MDSNIKIKPEILSLLVGSKTEKSLEEKINFSLAMFLFTERAITLARAAELAGLSIGEFTSLLIKHNVTWSEYADDLYEQDNESIKYILEAEKNNDESGM